MIQFSFRTLELTKLYPLAISRGTMASSRNLFVFAHSGEHVGVGELSPATGKAWTAERGETQLSAFLAQNDVSVLSRTEIWQALRDAEVDPPAIAALDVALWDLFAKQSGQPLYRVFGMPQRVVPTSVTIGINPPEVTRERVPDILRRTGAKFLKVKLGSPEGLDHDRSHFMAAKEAASGFGVGFRVDANGGWTVDGANTMIPWLAEQGVDYVEQPLPEGSEAELPLIFNNRKLPIFVDESCRVSSDIPRFAAHVDGINLKLMKCGGLTEALRIIATAKAFGLQTMIGCMSESSIAIAAGAAISGVLDHVDLDSHLNLNPDPATGAPIVDGVVGPSDRPGHGAELLESGA